jgi:hypothetical protein
MPTMNSSIVVRGAGASVLGGRRSNGGGGAASEKIGAAARSITSTALSLDVASASPHATVGATCPLGVVTGASTRAS